MAYNCLVKKERTDKHFIKMPEYPGGPKAMQRYIYEQLKYPKAALEANITGSVYIRYGIDQKGKVIETKVIKSLGHGCDEEACRVIKLLKFNVDKVRKKRIIYHKKIRVWFKPKKVTQASPTKISYSVTSAKKTQPSKPSYGYSITIKN